MLVGTGTYELLSKCGGELVTVGFKGPKLSEIVPAQSLSGLDQLRLQLKPLLSAPDDSDCNRLLDRC